MLAINHATSAACLVLALSILTQEPFFLPLILLVFLSSLLPDIDHPNSEISNIFPFVGRFIPHRQITHSLLAFIGFSALVYVILDLNIWLSLISTTLMVIGSFFTYKFAKAHLNRIQKLSNNFFSQKQMEISIRALQIILILFSLSLLVSIANPRLRLEIWVLLSLGYFLHILGDFVTKEGVPLFWPIKKRLGLKLFRTGSWVEKILGLAFMFGSIYLLLNFWNLYELHTIAYWSEYMDFQSLSLEY